MGTISLSSRAVGRKCVENSEQNRVKLTRSAWYVHCHSNELIVGAKGGLAAPDPKLRRYGGVRVASRNPEQAKRAEGY
jgi:hypothetical protein